MPEVIVREIGRYQIQRELGRGAFGRVYQAYDPNTRRLVAIKILPADAEPDSLQRFRREADITANLSHKNIVAVYGFEEGEHWPYLVMELITGQSLDKLIYGETSLSISEKVEILYQIAQGLKCAHDHGVTHRDVKPGNIMVGQDGIVKITDFGTADVRAKDGTRWTQKGDPLGTILYMAPELFNSSGDDRKRDIFAYGVLGYELLTGFHPFRAEDAGKTMCRILEEYPPPVRATKQDCPETLDRLIRSLTEKDPDVRCDSFDDVVLDLNPIRRELREQDARDIFSGVPALIEAGEYQSARQAIKQVLELSPGHEAARSLREDLRRREHQRLIEQRAKSLKEQGTALLRAGEFAKAVDLLQNAISLDESDQELPRLLAEAKTNLERVRALARYLSDARWEQRAGNLEGAIEKCSEALRVDSTNSDAVALLEALQQASESKRSKALLASAEKLVSEHKHHAALTLLDEIKAESPMAGEAVQLRRRIHRERSLALEQAARGITALIEAGDLTRAMTQVDEALERFGRELILLRSKQEVEASIQAAVRAEQWAAIRSEVETALRDTQVSRAIDVLERAKPQYVDTRGWAELFQAAQEAARKLENTRIVAETLKETAALELENRCEEALNKVERARVCVPDPQLDSIADRLRERIRAAEASQQRTRTFIQRIEGLIDAQDFEAAAALMREGDVEAINLRDREALSARIGTGLREREVNALDERVRLALARGELDAAEQEISRTRALLGNDERWASLDRACRERQYYETALLMAVQASASDERERAKEILGAVLKFAPDDRAEVMLREIAEKENQTSERRALVRDRRPPAEDAPVISLSAPSPPDEIGTRQEAPNSERSTGAHMPSRDRRWLRAVILIAGAGLIASAFVVWRSAPKTTTRTASVPDNGPATQPTRAETQWRTVQATEDPIKLKQYISAFPNGKFTAEATSRLQELAWRRLDRQDLNSVLEYVARFPNSPHAEEANELAAAATRERESAQDRSEILNSLSTYAAAIRRKDDVQLKRIWPTIPDIDLHLWRTSFASTRSISMELAPISNPVITDSTTRVYCRRKVTKIYSDGRPPYTDNGVVYVVLRKRGTQWVISSVSAP